MQDFENKLVVVNSKVLPEVIMKVLQAKKLRARGEAKSSTEACREVGISRSAYYKYKDSVFAYEEKLNQKIVSFYLVLRDEKGVLSSILTKLYELNTNVLTVNQNIPIDEVATVTISFRFENDLLNANAVKSEISNMYGVVDVKIISGK